MDISDLPTIFSHQVF